MTTGMSLSRSRLQRGAALLAWLAVGAIPASAVAQNDMCIPALGGLGGLPNTNDGVVLEDTGWTNATEFNLNAGSGSTATAQLLVGRTSTDVYLGLVVDSPSPGVDNTVVIAIGRQDDSNAGTTNDCMDDWKIHIKPWDTSVTNGTSQSPHIINFWRNSCESGTPPDANWNSASAVVTNPPTSHWLRQNTHFAKDGTRWQLEMRIPKSSSDELNGVFIPTTGPFRLYVNALSTSTLLGTVVQAPWPDATEIQAAAGNPFLNRLTPLKGNWGTASENSRPECTGLSLAWNQIGTKNTPSSQIRRPATACPPPNPNAPLGPTNVFFANVQNDTGVVAPGVSTTFRIANWGIPGATSWGPVPPGTNGTTMSQPVATAGTEFTRQWALTPAQSCDYAARPHQCLMVEMESTDASIRFKNRGATRNMDFVTASSFERSAEISAEGYGAPPPGRSNQEFVVSVDTEEEVFESIPDERGLAAFKPPSGSPLAAVQLPRLEEFGNAREVSVLQWQARGYLKSGSFLVINEREYEIAHLTGGFGYIAAHRGEVANWSNLLLGETVKKADEAGDFYTVEVPPEGVAQISTMIEAEQPGFFDRIVGSVCGKLDFASAGALTGGFLVAGFGAFWPRRRRRQ